MTLTTLKNIQLGFGGPALLEDVNLTIEAGERLCLIGRNGTGKTTLMRMIAGELPPDDGRISVAQGVRIARLAQEVPRDIDGTVFDVVAGGLGELSRLLSRYHQLSGELNDQPDEKRLARLGELHHELEAAGGWQIEQRVENTLSRLSLPADATFSSLSGGFKRRVLLAQALVTEPDLLLLDEPTNHLDIDAINWLEEFLLARRSALLFVTHDRVFLSRLATRIIELDRGRLTSWPGNFASYQRHKAEALESEARENQLFDKKLAQEETWIRQGIKARRTRNEGRVRALEAMRKQRRDRREREGKARLQIEGGAPSGKRVISAEQVSYGLGDVPVVVDFSTTILRGDKVGLIGPNGVGKTTLLNLLLGKLQPDSGHIELGTRLEVAYFDQMRAHLDDNRTVRDNLGLSSDNIEINGQTRHVIGYLQDFLFSPQRANSPVKVLSGGERNRLLLARLFARPANVLVMDEPTNDLDVETLELLEERLLEYTGTLLLVSHDRAFLNNVVTSTLVFEGAGKIGSYVGGYDDWLRQRRQPARSGQSRQDDTGNKAPKQVKPTVRRLGYKEQRELDALPALIEGLEAEQEQLQATMQDPAFYQQDNEAIAVARQRLQELGAELEQGYARWESLEA